MLRDDEDSNEDQDGLRLSISFLESLTPMKVGQCHCKLKAGNLERLWKTLGGVAALEETRWEQVRPRPMQLMLLCVCAQCKP